MTNLLPPLLGRRWTADADPSRGFGCATVALKTSKGSGFFEEMKSEIGDSQGQRASQVATLFLASYVEVKDAACFQGRCELKSSYCSARSHDMEMVGFSCMFSLPFLVLQGSFFQSTMQS